MVENNLKHVLMTYRMLPLHRMHDLFADDCLLYRHVNSQNDSDLLQKDLSALEKWEEEWPMSFHPQKCTVIRRATNQRHVIPTQYTLHGHTLEVVDSAKYLGVTISEDLQWFKHVDNTVSKANRTMGFNLRDCTKPVKAAAYTTMARPTLHCLGPTLICKNP